MTEENKEEIEEQKELFPTNEPFEEDDSEDEASEVDETKDEDEEEKVDGVDFKKRFDDSQLYIETLRADNKKQNDTIADLTSRLDHLDGVTKKQHEIVSPDEDYEGYVAPEKKDENADRYDEVMVEEKALVSVFSDYYEVVGKDGATDTPFLKAVSDEPALFQQVQKADKPAAEAYKIGLEYMKKNPKKEASEETKKPKPKKKSASLKDAPGDNVEPNNNSGDAFSEVFPR